MGYDSKLYRLITEPPRKAAGNAVNALFSGLKFYPSCYTQKSIEKEIALFAAAIRRDTLHDGNIHKFYKTFPQNKK